MALKVKCPTCKKEVEYSTSNPYRPFCSERCKMIDLGAWASGEYSIEARPNDDAELEQLMEAIAQKHNKDL